MWAAAVALLLRCCWLVDQPTGAVGTMVLAGAPAPTTAHRVLYWDMDAAVAQEGLTYEEQAFAFTLQGLVNRKGPDGTGANLMFSAGFLDFDWPGADNF